MLARIPMRRIGRPDEVAAVVVIGIEEGWTKRVVDGIAATGKPVSQQWLYLPVAARTVRLV